MRRDVGKLAVAALLALTAAGSVDAGAARPRTAASLCTPGEVPLFTCPIGRKLVSVCGNGRGAGTYRFGRPGAVELSSTALHFARTGYSGGGEAQIYFTNAGHRYIVFERTVRTGFGADGHNDPEFSAGVLVMRGERTVSRARCATEATMTGPVDTLAAGEFVYHD